MVERVVIQGTDELRDLIKRLREAGEKDILNALRRGIREAGKEAMDDVAHAVRGINIEGVGLGGKRTAGLASGRTGGHNIRLTYDVRRSRGNLARMISRAAGRAGLRDTIARSLTMQISGSAKSASVRIKVNSNMLPPDQRSLPRHLEKGEWRHPVFGTRRWALQRSTPDWFEGTLRRHAPEVRSAIGAEVSAALRKIQG